MNSLNEDFNRDVYNLFGLPVDNISIKQVESLIRDNKNENKSYVLSTININWVVKSFTDSKFRSAILNSDIVTLDGKPLLWFAKLFGVPIKSLVPGSSLIEYIFKKKSEKGPVSIFLFGGEKQVAMQAMQRINRYSYGLKAIGAINPGFGSVKDMSSHEIISRINRAKPDILLIALGAKKGTEWIEYNRDKLNARIISHLGATINFLAGTIKRSPVFFSNIGLEWVWRIFQEPKLFPRYARDGIALIKVLLSKFLLITRILFNKKYCNLKSNFEHIDVHHKNTTLILAFKNSEKQACTNNLIGTFIKCVHSNKDIILDLKSIDFISHRTLALISLLSKHQRAGKRRLHIITNKSRIIDLLNFFVFWDHPSKIDKYEPPEL